MKKFQKWVLAIMMSSAFFGVAVGCSNAETENEEVETEENQNTEDNTEEEVQ